MAVLPTRVSWNIGTPKWMVYKGKPDKMDDLGILLFQETSISSKKIYSEGM